MPRNKYISHGSVSEQNLLSDLIAEAIAIYGHETYYLPRKILKLDKILNEDVISEFADAYMCEMYIESIDGFEGDGKLISKFGLEIRDQLTFIVSVRRWNQLVGRFGYPEEQVRPREGDLVYLPMSKGLFEIKFVEDKKPFFQLNNNPTYKLIAELYEYPNTNIDTGVDEIDNVQRFASNGYSVFITYEDAESKFNIGDKTILTFSDDSTGSCEILETEATDDLLVDKVYIGPLTFDNVIFKTLVPDITITNPISSVSGVISSVNIIGEADDDDVYHNDDNAQNSQLELEGNSWIDFSITNPFDF